MPHSYFTRTILIAFVIMVLLTGSTCNKRSIPDPVSAASIEEFGIRLDNLRIKSNIPGMVAGIVKDGQVIWTKSYGYENVAQQKADVCFDGEQRYVKCSLLSWRW